MRARKQTNTVQCCVLACYNPDDILALRGDRHEEFIVGDFHLSVNMEGTRYRVFAVSKTCSKCGVVGVQMRLEYHNHPRGWIEPHFNLYALVDGQYVLMTQDHVIPKSKGGLDRDDNLVTMCSPCNERKGNKLC